MPKPYLTLIEFRNKSGNISHVAEVKYIDGEACIRYKGLFEPIKEADLERSCYYRDAKGQLQYCKRAADLIERGLFSEVKR